jgi:hypothetical protein
MTASNQWCTVQINDPAEKIVFFPVGTHNSVAQSSIFAPIERNRQGTMSTMNSLQKYLNESSSEMTAATVSTANSSLSTHDRKLRFSLEANEVFEIPHVDDMDESEVHETWYTKQDYDTIKNKMISLIKKMMKGDKIEESNKHTARGLEFRTRQGAMRRQNNKRAGITAVMSHQMQQTYAGIKDDKPISQAYIRATSHCLDEARELGVQDETAIKKDLERMRRKHSVPSSSKLTRTSSSSSSSSSKSANAKSSKKLGGINGILNHLRHNKRPEESKATLRLVSV